MYITPLYMLDRHLKSMQSVGPFPTSEWKQVCGMIHQHCLQSFMLLQGFCAEVFGPSLPDLTKQLGVDYERISYALSARYAGYSFGSVIAGLSLGQLHQHSDAIIAFCLVASSITFAAIPFSGQLWVTIILCGVFGTGRGFVAPGMYSIYKCFPSALTNPGVHFRHRCYLLFILPLFSSYFDNLGHSDKCQNKSYKYCVFQQPCTWTLNFYHKLFISIDFRMSNWSPIHLILGKNLKWMWKVR